MKRTIKVTNKYAITISFDNKAKREINANEKILLPINSILLVAPIRDESIIFLRGDKEVKITIVESVDIIEAMINNEPFINEEEMQL